MSWQPIDTAPKNKLILVSNIYGVWPAVWKDVYTSGYRPDNPWYSMLLDYDHMQPVISLSPTHWMPLPEPPNAPL